MRALTRVMRALTRVMRALTRVDARDARVDSPQHAFLSREKVNVSQLESA
jgi:hypothetical protein